MHALSQYRNYKLNVQPIFMGKIFYSGMMMHIDPWWKTVYMVELNDFLRLQKLESKENLMSIKG